MQKKRLGMIVGGLALAVGIAGGGIALAGGGAPSPEAPEAEEATVTGRDADRATAAALKITGGGRANSVELDSENGATWEVEVTKPDGHTVDVRLDEQYNLVIVESDSEASDTEE